MPQPEPAEASRIVETVEARAWWSLTEAVPDAMVKKLGLSIHRDGDITVATCKRFDDFVGNRAFGLHPPGHCSTAVLARIVARYRTQRLRNYALQVGPLGRPAGFADWLQANGLERRNRWAIVLRDDQPAAAVASHYEIREVAAAANEDFVRTTATAYGWPMIRARWMAATIGHPGWHHYVTYDNNTPIAAGALFEADGIGWLGMDATLAAYRRNGAHTSLIQRRIGDAISRGCRWIVAETGEANASYRHLQSTGFERVYWRDNYCEKRRPVDAVGEFSSRLGRALSWRLTSARSLLATGKQRA